MRNRPVPYEKGESVFDQFFREDMERLHADPVFRAKAMDELAADLEQIAQRIDRAATHLAALGEQELMIALKSAKWPFLNVRDRIQQLPEVKTHLSQTRSA